MFRIRLKDSRFFKQLAIFLAILGPGIITGVVDNYSEGITTFAVPGQI